MIWFFDQNISSQISFRFFENEENNHTNENILD